MPLDPSVNQNRKMNRTKEITTPELLEPKMNVDLRNHVNCMMIRMIANKNGSSDSLVRTLRNNRISLMTCESRK